MVMWATTATTSCPTTALILTRLGQVIGSLHTASMLASKTGACLVSSHRAFADMILSNRAWLHPVYFGFSDVDKKWRLDA